MLFRNANSKSCRHSIDEGDCCCNCAHKYTMFSNGFPCGQLCLIEGRTENDTMFHWLKPNEHSLCEMHITVGQPLNVELEID